LLLITYCFIELFAYAAYRIKFGDYDLQSIEKSKLDAHEQNTNSGVFEPAAAARQDTEVKPILHPYMGFTVDGKVRDQDCTPSGPYDCYRRIKIPSDGPLEKRSADKLIVAILGGSFADGTARGGTPDYYAHLLKGIQQFGEKTIVVYNLAAGAYKQPQQLMHLSYYYALGAEFDLVINIDGFNEMAATYYGWRDSNLHPSFPASWDKRVSSGVDADYIDLYSKKKILNSRHSAIASFFLIDGIRLSPLMNFSWQLLNANYMRQKSSLEQPTPAQQQTPRDFAYEALGPDYQLPDLQSFEEYAIALWANSSNALRALVEGQGGRYFHFLQPNQYIEGAKILSEFEQEHTVLEQWGYGNVYKQIYPKLAEGGRQLAAGGTHFYDLTFLFQDNAEDLYIDNCCHLNPKGYDMVARAIIDKITAQLGTDSAPLQSAND